MEEGQKLGKYEIHSTLGEGGMGIVYKAYDPHLARVVAIKTIRNSLLEGKSGQDLRERFHREARAEGRLVHPNIVTIYEYQEDEQGTPFFVMEYVEGKDLKQYLSRGIRFNLEKALHIIEQVLSALAHSHREGIVHRDIKPANIILLENDSVKIADFGIARMEESEFTQTGIVMGTPQYIAPEQRLGQRVDGRADLYSTGAVMFELLTGEKASPGISEGTLWNRIVDASNGRLDTGDPKTQRIFKVVVVKALARDPDDRFPTAEEFMQAIADARPTPMTKPAKPWAGILLGAVAGAALLAAVYFFTVSGTQSPPVVPSIEDEPVVAPASTLSPEATAALDKQLKVARTHLLVNRLLLPEGSNAIHSYQLALAIDPANVEAREGIEKVQTRLVERIEQSIARGDTAGAEEQMTLALRYFPESDSLLVLQRTLK